MHYISDRLSQNIQVDSRDYSEMFNKLKENIKDLKDDEMDKTPIHQSLALGMISSSQIMEIPLFKKASYGDLSKSLDDLINLRDFLNSVGADYDDGSDIPIDKVPIDLKKYFEYSHAKSFLSRVKSCKESSKRQRTGKMKSKLFF